MINKKRVVISAINLFEGGTLSVLKDCLSNLNNSKFQNDYLFVALVHKIDLFDKNEFSNIEFIEFPKSRKSYIFRLYYEYFYFRKVAKRNNVSFWLSLHDMTPNIGNIPQAVYCHNPSPFNSVNFSDLLIQPTQFFFSLFYKYLYKINIKKNKYIVVQQLWIKTKFAQMFDLRKDSIIIAKPQVPIVPEKYLNNLKKTKETTFFFPTFPRPFKNIEIICEAVKILNNQGFNNFEVKVTVDGTENKYAENIVKKYKDISNLKFIGLISRDQVYELYSLADCLIFPSKLETWGLPISEFKQFNKPMIVSDLPYAKETVGKFESVNFFNYKDAKQLSELMLNVINGQCQFDETYSIEYEKPYVEKWNELFQVFLKN
jgi:glycosyltransferase involved in cell wall biosynthesis